MPRRGTQQDLTNFEAMSLRLEPLAVVNAELLFGNMEIAQRADDHSDVLSSAVFRKRIFCQLTHATVASVARPLLLRPILRLIPHIPT